MALDAGFGMVLTLRQSMLQDMIRVYYEGGKLKHFWSLGDPSNILAADFFLELPKIIFLNAYPNDLIIDLRLQGALSVKVSNKLTESKRVTIKIRERVPHDITIKYSKPTQSSQAQSNLILGYKAGEAVNESLELEILEGGSFTSLAKQLLDSVMPSLIITVLSKLSDQMPSFNLTTLFGPEINQINPRVTGKSLDGFLVIGFDMPIEKKWTEGDPGQMIETTAGLDIGIWINPIVLPILLAGSTSALEDTIRNNGGSLDYVHLTTKEGHIYMDGKASGTGGSVTFSARLIPHLVRPGVTYPIYEEGDYYPHRYGTTPSREEIWIELDLRYDIDEDWWVTLIKTASLACCWIGVYQFVEGQIDMVRQNISSNVPRQHYVGERVQEITIPDIPKPSIVIRIDCFACHEDGIQIAALVKPKFSSESGRIDGPLSIPVEDIERTSIKYKIKLPSTVVADDPNLRIRWTVRRNSTVLLEFDELATNMLVIDLEPIKSMLYLDSHFTVECRVYTTLGPYVTDHYNGSVSVRIFDRIDRSHPFIRWNHYVRAPVVKVEENGSHTILGYSLKYRHSKIHRTDFPGRCLMVSRYSISDPIEDTSKLEKRKETKVIYEDALPFPVADLVKNRSEVCDYCFFGGPDKQKPIWPKQ